MVSPSAEFVRYHDVVSADGTRLRAWTNDADGPTVLLSNGLGANPHAWPSLTRPDCGIRVVSWNHRGVGGSAQPADGRVDLDSFVEDAIAVMDDAGLAAAVVVAWSAGVAVAFELANRHPERVLGILAVAGVPGDTFSTMLAPLRLPRPVAKQVMVAIARSAGVTGRLAAPLTRRFPWTTASANVLRASHFIGPSADPAAVRAVMQEFFTTHPSWYARLALGVSQQKRVSLSTISVPVTFLAGSWDVLAGARDMLGASRNVKGSRYRELKASHFIPLEQPEVVLDELRDLLRRAGT